MTRDDFTITEQDGCFTVCHQPQCVSFGDSQDLGRGSSMSLTRVHCRESAEYFIQARTYEAAMNRAVAERDYLIHEIEAALNKRSLRKRLREIIGRK